MKRICAAGNTVVPAILVLESMGFQVLEEGELTRAIRNGEEFIAEDPVTVLGLVTIVSTRGWSWQAADTEIDRVITEMGWN